MDEMVALRCKYCGAPLDEKGVKDDSPYITCSSCGTTQQKLDARAYLDQLMGQVRSWVSQAMPGGMSVAGSQSVDSVARHNIFMTSFKPKVDAEFSTYKFGFNNLISQVLMVMPFSARKISTSHTPTQAFEFGAKMNEIAPLAVSDETSRVMSEATKVTDAYALLLNNCALIGEDKPGRFTLMLNNFTMAAQDFSKLPEYAAAQARFEGLALLCAGSEMLINGDLASCRSQFEQGRDKLKTAAQGAMASMKVAVMGQATAQEAKMADVLIELADYVNRLGGSKDIFDAVRRIFTFTYPAQGNWAFLLNNHDRLAEIFKYMGDCVRAKNGAGTIPIAAGSGSILVPFWHIDLRYSFQTGSLWKKHSVEVTDVLLVPADFTIDGNCLNYPKTAVTDVFGAKGSNGFMAGLTGSETSISNSKGLGALVQSAAENGAAGRSVIVPLSTKREAERIAENYIQSVSGSMDKLKLSNPEVVGLVYVPFERDGNALVPNSGFGDLLPARVGRTALDQLVIL